ncbi:MAG: hypothetical protein EOP90_07005 [Lysobacteraceae bacterium]|nr:MAG: hypothetical protein EOP90_07005 [Xanthomonadaceae bacterium]
MPIVAARGGGCTAVGRQIAMPASHPAASEPLPRPHRTRREMYRFIATKRYSIRIQPRTRRDADQLRILSAQDR